MISTFVHNGKTSGKTVVTQGDLVFYGDSDGVYVLDGTNPAHLNLLASYDTPGTPLGLFVEGTTVYVADGSAGVSILELGT